eukprot:500329-Prymnesium_polylepis.1
MRRDFTAIGKVRWRVTMCVYCAVTPAPVSGSLGKPLSEAPAASVKSRVPLLYARQNLQVSLHI